MSISAIDGCPEQHWSDVREIIEEAIEKAGFEPRMVSDADEVGIIQKRIIQNVYDDPIVVCDVSGKNPNVMFELGMRLAFDKPTIIIKDDKTAYSFDTSPIEHIEYPRDLRFARIVEFQEEIALKVKATYEKSQTDRTYTTFLKHFGSFSVAKVETKTVDRDEFILDELRTMKSMLLRQAQRPLTSQEADRGISRAVQADYILEQAIRRALNRLELRKMKDKKNVFHLLRDYIIKNEQMSRYFESPEEFEIALANKLRLLGISR
jgi:preprotein translocase subunit SecB